MAMRSSLSMTHEEIAAYLTQARTLNVATFGPRGTIHVVATWYVMRGESPVFWTYAKSQKAVNLSRDSRMTGLVEDGATYETLRGVQLAGSAELVTCPEQVLRIGEELSGKYPGQGAGRDIAQAAAKRVGIILHPARTVSWDHRKLAR